MNAFEQSICKATVKAFGVCESITGNWLLHAPEHFLQNFLLLDLGSERYIYAEASYKKIVDGEGRPRKGRPPADKAKRYDLVAWRKSSDRLRAVIEIKRSWSLNQALKKDSARIKSEKHADAGYLLVYSETKQTARIPTINKKFEYWSGELKLNYLNPKQPPLGIDGEWVAGFALMRC